ncbi:MAG: Trehalose/maltose import ATP-binding protein MalK [Candidatus Methanocomedens sp.]|nr:MAG: Trehalose/maltose import ATP-binding protein MalK [ANME-2 cluster archaeon]
MSIEIRHLTHIYDADTLEEIKALDKIDLTIKKGNVFGLVGGIGSGKSTLASLIAGLEKPTGGSITIDGEPPCPGKNVGILFQQPEDFFFEKTLFRDMAFGLLHSGLTEDEVNKRIHSTLDLAGLDRKILDQSPFHLNRGTLRLAAFASVLAMRPGVIILDEPTASLDSQSRKRLVDIIKRISGAITIIYISHRLQEVIEVSDSLAVLDKGNITFTGTRPGYLDWAAGQDGGGYLPILNQIMYRLHKLDFDVDFKVTKLEDAVGQIQRTLEKS